MLAYISASVFHAVETSNMEQIFQEETRTAVHSVWFAFSFLPLVLIGLSILARAAGCSVRPLASLSFFVIGTVTIPAYLIVNQVAVAMTCRTSEKTDAFLAYCTSPQFGDYEHGAYYLEMEPQAVSKLRSADVVILGNSRTQFAFSSTTTKEFFDARSISFYSAGFGYSEFSVFGRGLVDKLALNPKVLIIDATPFFHPSVSPPAQQAMSRSLNARWQFWLKKVAGEASWAICNNAPLLCPGKYGSIWRLRSSGAWEWKDVLFPDRAIPFGAEDLRMDYTEEDKRVARQLAADFFSSKVNPKCVAFTSVPNPMIDGGAFATEIAELVGSPIFLPKVENLASPDGSHLSFESAERWSAAFLDQANTLIQRCTRLNSG